MRKSNFEMSFVVLPPTILEVQQSPQNRDENAHAVECSGTSSDFILRGCEPVPCQTARWISRRIRSILNVCATSRTLVEDLWWKNAADWERGITQLAQRSKRAMTFLCEAAKNLV